MTDSETKKFKIDLSAPLPDEPLDDAPRPEHSPSAKPERRPLWMIFIVVVIMGAAFVWGYYDLRGKLTAVDATGATEISGLSEQFNEKIEKLELRIADGETALRKHISGLETQLKTVDSSFSELRARKADKSELKTIADRVAADAAALKKDMEGIQKQILELSTRAESAMAAIDKIKPSIEDNARRIETIAGRTIDNDALKAALAAEREFTQQNMAHAAETLYSDVAALQKAVNDLRSRIDKITQSIAEQKKPEKPAAPETPRPSTGGIVEQEIK